jgi:PAS domain-containing protein
LTDSARRNRRAPAIGPSEWNSIIHVLDALPGYALLIDDEHRIVLANRAALDQAGRTPAQVLGAYCPKVMHGLAGPFPGFLTPLTGRDSRCPQPAATC